MTNLVQVLGDTAIQFTFWSSIAFMLVYTGLAKWWKSSIGWARISLDFAIALTLSPDIIELMFHKNFENNSAAAWYVICSLFSVGVVALWNLAIVVRRQLRGSLNDSHTTDRDAGPEG